MCVQPDFGVFQRQQRRQSSKTENSVQIFHLAKPRGQSPHFLQEGWRETRNSEDTFQKAEWDDDGGGGNEADQDGMRDKVDNAAQVKHAQKQNHTAGTHA